MSIGEFFGIKQCKITAQNCRNIEELFQKIRNEPFEAGRPELCRNEGVIAFPAIDRNNQLQIYGADGNFVIMRSTAPTSGNVMDEEAFERVARSLPEFYRIAGSRKKLCMVLCQRTADEINDMEL